MRRFLAPITSLLLILGIAAAVSALRQRPATPPDRQAIPRALARGVEFLLRQQNSDGAWRSENYGTFQDGSALTPLALVSLQEADPTREEARRRAARFLTQYARPDGSIDEGKYGLDFPVYTASLSVRALSAEPDSTYCHAREAWLTYLLDRQLLEANGWRPEDAMYGGWGYCRTIPHKPVPGELSPPLVESNLSATMFALDALDAAGHHDHTVRKAAGVFVQRMQNPDGGFAFVPGDPVRNKAGIPGYPDSTGPAHSYGSTTADGIRCLAATGLPTHSARDWLIGNVQFDRHPGVYIAAHEANRDAVYFYYAASLMHSAQRVDELHPHARTWSVGLAEALIQRQQPDGSWSNPIPLVREDDPIIATCWALQAMARCQKFALAK